MAPKGQRIIWMRKRLRGLIEKVIYLKREATNNSALRQTKKQNETAYRIDSTSNSSF